MKNIAKQALNEVVSSKGAKKNTRKWCRGKVGISHIWSDWAKMFPTLPFSRMVERHCIECGKKDYNYRGRI